MALMRMSRGLGWTRVSCRRLRLGWCESDAPTRALRRMSRDRRGDVGIGAGGERAEMTPNSGRVQRSRSGQMGKLTS